MSQDYDDRDIREKIHQIDMRISHHDVEFIQTDKKILEINKKLDTNSLKIDRLVSRMTIIASFGSGVLFISSESGGEILRSLLGLVI